MPWLQRAIVCGSVLTAGSAFTQFTATTRPAPPCKQIDLPAGEMEPREFVHALAEQAGVKFAAELDSDHPVISPGKTWFWPAILEAAAERDWRLQFSANRYVFPELLRTLNVDSRQTGLAQNQWCQFEGYCVQPLVARVSQLVRTGNATTAPRMSVGLRLLLDPASHYLYVKRPELRDGVTDTGESLVSAEAADMQQLYNGLPPRSLDAGSTLTLLQPKKEATTLAHISGRALVGRISRYAHLEMPDPLHAGIATVQTAWGQVLVRLEQREMSTRRSFRLTAELRPDKGVRQIDFDILFYHAPGLAELHAADGTKFNNSYLPEVDSGARPRTVLVRTFSLPTGPSDPGEPALLVWDIPIEAQDIVIPFHFSNLPLP